MCACVYIKLVVFCTFWIYSIFFFFFFFFEKQKHTPQGKNMEKSSNTETH